jgi:hypothetical protein
MVAVVPEGGDPHPTAARINRLVLMVGMVGLVEVRLAAAEAIRLPSRRSRTA